MRTETTTRTLYKFNELSDEAKEEAIEKLYDINIDYDWWDSTYEDAENIGLKIIEFDIDRGSYCKGKIIFPSIPEVAEAILKEHGESCETYKDAKSFLSELNELAGKYDNIEDCPEDEIEDLEDNFLKTLLEDYRIILSHEYDYLTSKEAIIETIEANDYEFLENGTLA